MALDETEALVKLEKARKFFTEEDKNLTPVSDTILSYFTNGYQVQGSTIHTTDSFEFISDLPDYAASKIDEFKKRAGARFSIAHAMRYKWFASQLENLKGETPELKGHAISGWNKFIGKEDLSDEEKNALMKLFGAKDKDELKDALALIGQGQNEIEEQIKRKINLAHALLTKDGSIIKEKIDKSLNKNARFNAMDDTDKANERALELQRLFRRNRAIRFTISILGLIIGIAAALAFAASFSAAWLKNQLGLPLSMVWGIFAAFGIPSIYQEGVVCAKAIPGLWSTLMGRWLPANIDELLLQEEAKLGLVRKRDGNLYAPNKDGTYVYKTLDMSEKAKRQRKLTFGWKIAIMIMNATGSTLLVFFGFAGIFGLVASGSVIAAPLLVVPALLALSMFIVSISFNLNRALAVLEDTESKKRWHGNIATSLMLLASVGLIVSSFLVVTMGFAWGSFLMAGIAGVMPLIAIAIKARSYQIDKKELREAFTKKLSEAGVMPDVMNNIKAELKAGKCTDKNLQAIYADYQAQLKAAYNNRFAQTSALLMGMFSGMVVALSFFSLQAGGMLFGPYLAMFLVPAIAYTQYLSYRGSVNEYFSLKTQEDIAKLSEADIATKPRFERGVIHTQQWYFNSKYLKPVRFVANWLAELVNGIKGVNKFINAAISLAIFFGLLGGAGFMAIPGGQAVLVTMLVVIAAIAIMDGAGVYFLYRPDFRGKMDESLDGIVNFWKKLWNKLLGRHAPENNNGTNYAAAELPEEVSKVIDNTAKKPFETTSVVLDSTAKEPLNADDAKLGLPTKTLKKQ